MHILNKKPSAQTALFAHTVRHTHKLLLLTLLSFAQAPLLYNWRFWLMLCVFFIAFTLR